MEGMLGCPLADGHGWCASAGGALAETADLGVDVGVSVDPRARESGGCGHGTEGERSSGVIETTYGFGCSPSGVL